MDIERKFGMNDPITREQMAQIIDNALDDYLKLERSEATLNFTDDQIKSMERIYTGCCS